MAEHEGRRARSELEQRLEVLLKAWGRELYGDDYREQHVRKRWEAFTANHPMNMVLGKPTKRLTRVLVGRGGLSRRIRMGQAAGRVTSKGHVLPVPMYAVDPVPCKERRGSGSIGSVHSISPQLSKVEQAVQRLEEVSMVRALCIRVHYADFEAQHRDKFPRVNEHMRRVNKHFEGIDVNRFRDELTFGRVFLHGALFELLARAA
jgi:hypothetical protein